MIPEALRKEAEQPPYSEAQRWYPGVGWVHPRSLHMMKEKKAV